MRNIDENTITQAVLARQESCTDPRLKEVLDSLVRHLHDFAREVKLTESEWFAGIEFLTATGHKCDAKRQEFILLSDTLGLSMLTVAMNTASPPGVTESTVFGPFHVPGAPAREHAADISVGAVGEPLFVQATVCSAAGAPVPNAEVDVWQVDGDGLYDVQRPGLDHHQGRATLNTDSSGRLSFRTVLPVSYPIPTDGPVGVMLRATGRHSWRPAHIHFMIKAEGFQSLTTHVFRDGDPYLDSDAVFGVRSSLVGHFETHPAGAAPDGSTMSTPFHSLRFEFVLQPL
jgi:hydroxyquinol 1,2-dioxygenase